MFEIIKNLPIPVKEKGLNSWKRANKYPFVEMEIGDCLAFNAQDRKDPMFKKIYGSAMSFARRVKAGYTFTFAKIEDGKFGCWKVATGEEQQHESNTNERKIYKKRASTIHITKDMLIAALENEGTLNGAARMLNISSRTFSRLKQKFELA